MASSPTDPASQPSAPARRGAHPVPHRRLPAALFGARMAARTVPRGAREMVHAPRIGSIEQVERHKRALLVTFRRDGTPVPTPVWAARGAAHLYVRSERDAGKLKRLRNDSRLLVAPCTLRGRPLGAPFEARARMLAREQEPIAEAALAARYGLGRELFERTMDLLRIDMCFLEVTPGAWAQSAASAAELADR
jgi:uncharacterized protein